MDFEIQNKPNEYRGPDKFWLPILKEYLEKLDESVEVKGVKIKGKIFTHSTIEDIMILFDYHNVVQVEKRNRTKYGPGYARKVENWIREIEAKVTGLRIEEKDGKMILINDQPHAVRSRAFNDMMDGKAETPISDYARYLMISDTNASNMHGLTVDPYFFFDIAVGAGYGTIFHGLYDELENIKKCEEEDLQPNLNQLELPDISDTKIQILGFLYKIGITDYLRNLLGNNNSAVGKVIERFTGIHWDTVKKGLQAIYTPNQGNEKLHPFNVSSNEEVVNELIEKLKIDSEVVEDLVKRMKIDDVKLKSLLHQLSIDNEIVDQILLKINKLD